MRIRDALPDRPPGGALARCVGDVEAFETHHWGRRPIHRHGSSVDAFRDVLTTGDLDEFLGSGIRRPVIRLVRDGSPLPGERYTSRVRIGGSDFRDVVDPARVAELFADGATVVAQSLHRTHPKVRAFTEGLGDEISHPIQANAYLTPPHATGLSPHADGHDVVVIQLAGSKRWSVDGLDEFELHAGDTLYVPAGTEHSATSNDRTSLHLTLGILRVTYRAVLDRVLRDGPSRLDDPLPLRYRMTDADMQNELRDIVGEVRRHLGSVDVSEVQRTERARPASRPPRPGALTSAIQLSDIAPIAVVARGDDPWSVTGGEHSPIRLERDGHWMVVPASCSGAVEQLNSGNDLKIDELTGLDDDGKLILARRLVAAGFCRIVED